MSDRPTPPSPRGLGPRSGPSWERVSGRPATRRRRPEHRGSTRAFASKLYCPRRYCERCWRKAGQTNHATADVARCTQMDRTERPSGGYLRPARLGGIAEAARSICVHLRTSAVEIPCFLAPARGTGAAASAPLLNPAPPTCCRVCDDSFRLQHREKSRDPRRTAEGGPERWVRRGSVVGISTRRSQRHRDRKEKQEGTQACPGNWRFQSLRLRRGWNAVRCSRPCFRRCDLCASVISVVNPRLRRCAAAGKKRSRAIAQGIPDPRISGAAGLQLRRRRPPAA